MNLADDPGGAGTDLDLAVRVCLDHPTTATPVAIRSNRAGSIVILASLSLALRQRDRRAAGRGPGSALASAGGSDLAAASAVRMSEHVVGDMSEQDRQAHSHPHPGQRPGD